MKTILVGIDGRRARVPVAVTGTAGHGRYGHGGFANDAAGAAALVAALTTGIPAGSTTAAARPARWGHLGHLGSHSGMPHTGIGPASRPPGPAHPATHGWAIPRGPHRPMPVPARATARRTGRRPRTPHRHRPPRGVGLHRVHRFSRQPQHCRQLCVIP